MVNAHKKGVICAILWNANCFPICNICINLNPKEVKSISNKALWEAQ